ncbi:AzlD domain-containing protein [Shinella curvata]|uniref:AzlD domain-containing protein n=1 Tax=Shinella curvata TaxID=1817964 RepID=A0ABT8X8T7_9HYPH|nr:AzlD domain-containing protein [Shinella curvata]MCJ8051895.1 AzlD domain-containing protein [Shinella curvata]MDO6120157.1 AzlD domain-containing protein [Shinella curvata]
MSFEGPWPYIYIAIAGWLATDFWRWSGVIAGNRIDEKSEVLNWVRAVATALVAAVIAKLIFFPTGTLESSPLWLRLGAVLAGALFFFFGGRFRQILGIAAAIAFLAAGLAIIGA